MDRMDEEHVQQPTEQTDKPRNDATAVADTSRHVPTELNDTPPHAAPHIATSRDRQQERTSKHILSTRDVQEIFDASGIPRNKRSIERYCKHGSLDAFYDAVAGRYFITRESVDVLTAQLKDIQLPKHNQYVSTAAYNDTVYTNQRHGTTTQESVSEMPRHTSDNVGTHAATTPRLNELEAEVMSLRIDKQVRDRLIEELKAEFHRQFSNFTSELKEQARQVGELQTKLQIEAPRRTREAEDTNITETLAYAPSVASYRDKEVG